MTQKERMLTGKLYTWDEELARDHARKDELISRLSAASPGARESLLGLTEGMEPIELSEKGDYNYELYDLERENTALYFVVREENEDYWK